MSTLWGMFSEMDEQTQYSRVHLSPWDPTEVCIHLQRALPVAA